MSSMKESSQDTVRHPGRINTNYQLINSSDSGPGLDLDPIRAGELA
jgi:hypothetical protein